MKTNNYLKNLIKKNHMSEIDYNVTITINSSGIIEYDRFEYGVSFGDFSKDIKLTRELKTKLKLNKYCRVTITMDTKSNKCKALIKWDKNGEYIYNEQNHIHWELDYETSSNIIDIVTNLVQETQDIIKTYNIGAKFRYLSNDRGFLGTVCNKDKNTYVAKIGETVYTNVEDYRIYNGGDIFGGVGFDKNVNFVNIKINGEWLHFKGTKLYRKAEFPLQPMEMANKAFKDYFLYVSMCGDKNELFKKVGKNIELIGVFSSIIASTKKLRLYDYELDDALRIGKKYQEEAEINLDGEYTVKRRKN